MTTTPFRPLQLKWSDTTTYFLILLFIGGNLILPQLCHLIPSGGLIFLPIYFFTLIGSYKFGPKVGLLTALLSPILNYVFFGMPPLIALPAILVKSCLLAFAATYVAATYKKISIFHILAVVLIYQIAGSFVELVMTQSLTDATLDLKMGIPGMLIQIFGGWILLKKLAKYEF